MKSYFRFMTSNTGRVLRFLVGVAILAWGYTSLVYPANVMAMLTGGIYAAFALFNISLFGLAFEYSMSGSRLIQEMDAEDGIPAEGRGRLSARMFHVLKYMPTHPKGWAVWKQNNFTLSH